MSKSGRRTGSRRVEARAEDAQALQMRGRTLLMTLLFLTGATALAYEVVWTRMLVATFGATVYAMGAVITSFMAGMALGSYIFGRYIDRGRVSPLVLFGVFEIVIGLFAIFLPVIIEWVTGAHIAAFQRFSASFFAFSLLRFALCFLALVVPTTLMGATLPVVAKFAVRRLPQLGSTVGALYAVNTFGGVVGTFVTGLFLIELLGMRTTSIAAATINAAVGLVAIGVGMRAQASVKEPASSPAAPEGARARESEAGAEAERRRSRGIPLEARLVLVGTGVGGMAALASEVLWTRIMVYVLGNFVHSFSLVLMSFLFGIALGSSVMSRRLARPGVDIRTFAALQLGIGVVALAMIPLFAPLVGLRELFLDRLTGAGATLETPDPWWPFTFWRMGISFLMLTVPTFLMGASFPLAAKIYARGAKRTGRGVGDVYAVNTTGAIVGSFLASFVLVGAFGVRASAMGAAFVSVGLALALFWLSPGPLPVTDAKSPSRKRSRSKGSSRGAGRSGAGGTDRTGSVRVSATCVGIAAVALALVGIPRDVFVPMYATAERGMALIYVDESPSGTVTVHRAQSGNMVLDINGQNVAGTKFGFLSTQKLQAHFPILAHPDPKSVMQIGFGSGGTCWSISTHPEIERVDCVEISPSVIEASERYMEEMHHNVLDDPRVSLEIEDARNFVLATDRKYDIILSDSIHPNYVGNGSLYTSDYFELCSTRLDEDGILSFWLPTYLLSVEDYKMIVRSLHSVFPHIVIWYMNNTVEGYSVTMGSKSPIRLDLDRVRRALAHESVRADLAQVRMDDPLAIADCLAVHGDIVDEFLGEGLLNTEDRPLIEFRASRNMLRERGEWMNLREIASARRFPGDMIVNWGADAEEEARLRDTMQRYFDATTHILQGHLYHIVRDARAELREYEAALAMNPDDVDAPYLAERVVRLSRRLPVD